MVAEYPGNRVANRVKSLRINIEPVNRKYSSKGRWYLPHQSHRGWRTSPFFSGDHIGRIDRATSFFSKDERVCDFPEILKDSWIGFMDTVTRADDADMLLLILEYYPYFDDT